MLAAYWSIVAYSQACATAGLEATKAPGVGGKASKSWQSSQLILSSFGNYHSLFFMAILKLIFWFFRAAARSQA